MGAGDNYWTYLTGSRKKSVWSQRSKILSNKNLNHERKNTNHHFSHQSKGGEWVTSLCVTQHFAVQHFQRKQGSLAVADMQVLSWAGYMASQAGDGPAPHQRLCSLCWIGTRSTRPIDAKLSKKLCLWIMFDIEISHYQTPPYQRFKIFQYI